MKKIIFTIGVFASIIIFAFVTKAQQQYMKIDASFYSQALDEEKMVDIFLPGNYFTEPDMQFPVIYYLHGAGGNQNEGQLFAYNYYDVHAEDTTSTHPAAIFVSPSGDCEPYRGSFYVNSDLYGNYEDYIIEDLIPFIEREFRVIPEKDFRFITGQSMGGYGSSYLSLRHPEMFRAAAPGMAAHLAYPLNFMDVWVDTLAWENGSYHFSYDAGHLTRLFFSVCGAFSPNLELEPEPIEMIFDTTGQLVDSVFEKWQPFIPINLLQELTPEDKLAFFLQCGTNDDYYCYPAYLEFSEVLDEKEIEYAEAYHEGGHEFDLETTLLMFRWMDSLIAVSYDHVGIAEGGSMKIPELTVYPNPASDNIQVQINTAQGGVIEILNSQGVLLKQQVLEEGVNIDRSFKINIQTLPAGVFLVRFRSGHSVRVGKIIKL
jgi:S-formylglutathione hydrolase FrmB